MEFQFDGSEGSISVRVWEHRGAPRLVVIWHGAWKRPTIAALGHAQEAVDRGPTFADLPLLWIHGTEDPLVPIAFVRPAIERLRGADFTAHEHAGGRHEVFNEIDRERAIDVLCTFVARVAP